MSKSIFTEIYEKNSWGNIESRSGPGSTLTYTDNLRKELKRIFNIFKINTIFDAPCGDFNWMKELIVHSEIQYIGADIVSDLIDINENYAQDNIKFQELDITQNLFPAADLWICRDCFIHLSYKDIILSLTNFVNSDIKYILTTTHTNLDNFVNKDIETGGFRYIDLFLHPFCFPANVLDRIEDYKPPFKSAELIMYERSQIAEIIESMNINVFGS